MTVEIVCVPYDSGHRSLRMGRGPEHLLRHGMARHPETASVGVHTVEAQGTFATEIGTSFALYRQVSHRVRAIRTRGSFPLVLSGNCGTALGTVAGCDANTTGVVWFDAHGDFHTPETSTGGFLDGMALAALVGRCWRGPTSTIPNFAPVSEHHVVHIGGRDFDPPEVEGFAGSDIVRIIESGIHLRDSHAALDVPLEALRKHVTSVYIHVDLDVLDLRPARANEYAPSGGLTIQELKGAIQMIGEHFEVRAAAVTAFDPEQDVAGRGTNAAHELAGALIRAAGR